MTWVRKHTWTLRDHATRGGCNGGLINIKGNHFADALTKSFKQSFSRAESLKKQAATSKYQKQIFQAMRPIFAQTWRGGDSAVDRALQTRFAPVEAGWRIVGMGRSVLASEFAGAAICSRQLKLEVVRLDGFRRADGWEAGGASLNEAALGMAAA